MCAFRVSCSPCGSKSAASRADTSGRPSGRVSMMARAASNRGAFCGVNSSGSTAANKQQLDQGRADYESGKQQLSAGVYGDTIRISVGIEDAEDLIQDFKQSIENI